MLEVMRRKLLVWLALLALAAPLGPTQSWVALEPLAKKKQNFGPAKLNCKNRRTYADYVRCGFL
jgi:hypothetical protein